MLLSYFEAVFEIMELNTTEVELSGVKNNLFFNIHRARRAVKYQNESRSISGDILLLI